MPTYEYECKSCGHSFEAFQSMKDEAISSCPECGQAVRRMIHGGMGIIFKGSGFYVTDNGGSKGRSSSDKSASSGGTTHSGPSSAPSSDSSAASAPSPCANCPKTDSSSSSKEKAAG